jgi:hypothetical protein
VVNSFGLLGRWAMDCAQPAGPANVQMNYAIGADGSVTESLGRGAATADRVSTLINVQLVSPEWLLYSLRNSDGSLLTVLTFREGQRKKSWWSVGSDGTPYIVNGKFVSTAGEPPYLQKCETAP